MLLGWFIVSQLAFVSLAHWAIIGDKIGAFFSACLWPTLSCAFYKSLFEAICKKIGSRGGL